MIAEALRPDGQPVFLDAAAEEFRRQNVSISVTPTCCVDCSDGCRVGLGCRSNNDIAQCRLIFARRTPHQTVCATAMRRLAGFVGPNTADDFPVSAASTRPTTWSRRSSLA